MDDNERTRLAGSILGNPIFEESLAVLKEGYVQQIVACAPTDNEGRWRYASALKDLEVIKRHLTSVFNKGVIAEREAKELAERESVFKRAVRNFY